VLVEPVWVRYLLPYVSIRQHTSAYVSMRQHAHAYAGRSAVGALPAAIRQHTSAYVSMRQHMLVEVLRVRYLLAYVSIRQHASACVSIRQHASSYAGRSAAGALLAGMLRRGRCPATMLRACRRAGDCLAT
jgi:hypothetical protein